MTTPFPFYRGLYMAVLFLATFLSVVAGIIAGAVHGAWGYLGLAVIPVAVMAAELYAARRREIRDMELEELVGPLPATDQVDLALLDQHLRAWSEEG